MLQANSSVRWFGTAELIGKIVSDWAIRRIAFLQGLGIVTVIGAIAIALPRYSWENSRFDSIMDAAISLSVFTISLLLLLSQRLQKRRSFNGLAPAFLATAVLRFLDSTTEDKDTSILLHLFCNVILSSSFFLEWVPLFKVSARNKRRIWIGVLASLFIGGVFGFVKPHLFPSPLSETTFTPFFKGINIFAGLLFVIAAYFGCSKMVLRPFELKPVIWGCLFFGLGAFLSAVTQHWETRWWIAQAAELAPTVILVSYLILTHNRKLVTLTHQLRSSNEQLQQFATIASHDIKEPLRTIANYLELLRRENLKVLDENSLQYLAFAMEGAQRLSCFTDAILEYSQVGARRQMSTRVDLNLALQRALHNLEIAIRESGAKFRRVTLPIVYGDSTLLAQLFQNLISNSLKYRKPNAAPEIIISAKEERDKWVISVADNGIGFDTRNAEKIFAPFQRLVNRSEYPGSGVGLATCRTIVDRHGGKIWATSTPDYGSVFSFTITKRPFLPIETINDA